MRAMSEVTRSRERSSSRRTSPTRSSKSPARRIPLHARSDSQTNEVPTPTSASFKFGDDDNDAPNKDVSRSQRDVFPRLPNQFLSPTASSGIDIYEDSTASPIFNVLEAQPVQDTPPRRPPRTRSQKGKARKKASPHRDPVNEESAPTWNAPRLPPPSLSPSPALSPSSLVSIRRAQLEELDAAARREEETRRKQLAARSGARSRQSVYSTPSLAKDQDESIAQSHDKAFLERYQSLVLNHFKPDNQEVSQRTVAHYRSKSQQSLKESMRPRSRSSSHVPDSRPQSRHASRPTSSRSRKSIHELSHQSMQDEAPGMNQLQGGDHRPQSTDRPRSVSMPPQDTEALIDALLSDGIEIQYPILQKPSVASMKSETSSTRRAYPRPLRLSRKRGDAQLALTASRTSEAGSENRTLSNQSSRRLIRSSISAASLTIPENAQASYAFDFTEGPDLTLSIIEDAHRSGFTDELGDTLGELTRPPMLRHQYSMARSSLASLSGRNSQDMLDSRPTTSGSEASTRNFFYQWLNNSRVEWARIYYTGQERLDLESPSVTDVTVSPRTPSGLVRTPGSFNTTAQDSWAGSLSRTPGSWTTITGRSSSPSSSGYAENIYIPRIRPMIHQDTSSVVITPSDEDVDDDEDEDDFEDAPEVPSRRFSYAADEHTPTIQEASEATRQRAYSWHSPSDTQHHLSMVDAALHRRARLDPPFNPMSMPETPHLPLDKRNRHTLQSWKAPSLDDTRNPLTPINRQFWLLIAGFIFPLAWMIGAVLPIPAQPHWRRDGSRLSVDEPKLEEGLGDLWDFHENRRWKKAQRWRVYNRFMSVVGVAVIAVVIVFALIGSHA